LVTDAWRESPPQSTSTSLVASKPIRGKRAVNGSAPGEVTTTTRSISGLARNACTVCHSIGRPAINWYCLGKSPPARVPVPAEGISAKRRRPAGEETGMGSVKVSVGAALRKNWPPASTRLARIL
jgi:transcription-repair coupling factor (superfamily II helicase)